MCVYNDLYIGLYCLLRCIGKILATTAIYISDDCRDVLCM